jgi:hypothetical protein
MAMDDFRTQLKEAIDAMSEAGVEPIFLVIDLAGSTYIKRGQGIDSFEKFRQSALDALAAAADGCDTFTYGEERIVGILPGFSRLKTFALIERLRRILMMLAQSYDCTLSPDFDAIELDPATGVAGIVNHLAAAAREADEAARREPA